MAGAAQPKSSPLFLTFQARRNLLSHHYPLILLSLSRESFGRSFDTNNVWCMDWIGLDKLYRVKEDNPHTVRIFSFFVFLLYILLALSGSSQPTPTSPSTLCSLSRAERRKLSIRQERLGELGGRQRDGRWMSGSSRKSLAGQRPMKTGQAANPASAPLASQLHRNNRNPTQPKTQPANKQSACGRGEVFGEGEFWNDETTGMT
jgi:hypothetical protein